MDPCNASRRHGEPMEGGRRRAKAGSPSETAAGPAAWLPSPARRLRPGSTTRAPSIARAYTQPGGVWKRVAGLLPQWKRAAARGRYWQRSSRGFLYFPRASASVHHVVCSHVHCAVTCTVPPAHRGQAPEFCYSLLSCGRVCASRRPGTALRSPSIDVPLL